jgi:squalene-hopene/tetraprenyl-beta-curcumene cyclase
MSDLDRIRAAYHQVRDDLLAERTSEGYWVGELSSSALSTATAIFALRLVEERSGTRDHLAMIQAGAKWLQQHQNSDGGWGDTTKSLSNISTTMLCRAALSYCDPIDSTVSIESAEAWLTTNYGPKQGWPEAIRKRYGKDRTFAVPILTMNALAGLVKWNEVPRLPFEAAALPQSWYRFVKLPVVSYALPALIAIGQTIEHHRSNWNPFTKLVRRITRSKALRVLRRMQPSTGGYLEATPLTAFVTMSLSRLQHLNEAGNEVIECGVKFLVQSMREDGSWPIDTNLSLWVTTLSINALTLNESNQNFQDILPWLMQQQQKEKHPFTGAAPGGWGWSHLSGSVPDCDDTPSMLLALKHLKGEKLDRKVIENGISWLLSLQNSDGGWPTFCKGWGLLPFDRSSNDLTAHAIRALFVWARDFQSLNAPIMSAIHRGFEFLDRKQRPDGSWLPLWFGNQHLTEEENPIYGTAQVMKAYAEVRNFLMNSPIITMAREDFSFHSHPAWTKGREFLLSMQHNAGSWGDREGLHPSIEETALALSALLYGPPCEKVLKGLDWLLGQVECNQFAEPSPIGFYFAKLWYFEKLYPLIYATSALGQAVIVFNDSEQRNQK